MIDRPRIPAAKVRALAVAASVDERTIRRVLADPRSAEANIARTRAADALRAAGLLSIDSSPPPVAA